jgi:quinol monooxygenase YgiN
MFVVTVSFVVDSGFEADFKEAVIKQAQNSLALEADCHVFDVCVAVDNAASIFLYEKYSDANAFDDHLASKHFKSFDALVGPWVKSKTVHKWSTTGETS